MTVQPMTNTERVALLPKTAGDYETLLVDYAGLLEKADDIGLNVLGNDLREVATFLSTIPNVDELVRAAYLEGHHRGRCDPSLTIWHSADEDWETSKSRAALNQEKDAQRKEKDAVFDRG